MGVYKYTARSGGHGVVTGSIEADSYRAAVRELHRRGVAVLRIQRRAEPATLRFFASSKVGSKDLAVFTRQFATMIHAGVPLLRTLSILEEQISHRTFKSMVNRLRADVSQGSSLSTALARHPEAFGTLYVNMVKAGETGGVLAEVLLRLAGFLEKDVALRQKVKAASVYPVLLACAALGSLIFMTSVIIPQFATLFESLGDSAPLPAPTQLALSIGTAVQSSWWLGAVIILVIVFTGRYVLRMPTGRVRYDRTKLRIPILGPLNTRIVVARFARTLGTLVGCGIPIVKALEVAAAAADNVVVCHGIDAVRASVREGESIAGQLAATRLFSSMMVQMVKVGEETGALDAMLTKVADFYDSEVDSTLGSLTSALEPVLIVGMGVVIGSMLVSLYLPIFSLATAAR